MDAYVSTLFPNDVLTFDWKGFSYCISAPCSCFSRLSLSEVDGVLHVNLVPIDVDLSDFIIK